MKRSEAADMTAKQFAEHLKQANEKTINFNTSKEQKGKLFTKSSVKLAMQRRRSA